MGKKSKKKNKKNIEVKVNNIFTPPSYEAPKKKQGWLSKLLAFVGTMIGINAYSN